MLAIFFYTVALGQMPPSAFEPTLFPASPAVLPTPQPSTEHAFLLQFDRDRNGVLTLDELPDPLRKRFDRADLNRDGKLDARELLVGPTRISREARRTEGVRVTRQGLARKGPGNADQAVVFRVGTEILRRLDRNGDGYADAAELGTLLQQPGILFGDPRAETTPQPVPPPSAVASSDSPPLSPFQDQPLPISPTNPPIATDRADPIAHPGVPPTSAPVPFPVPPSVATSETTPTQPRPTTAEPSPAAAASGGSGNLPDAPTILKNLDKNKNGQLDRDEAVDQLAANFDRLDKNRDGMLSEQEIKRGLALARLFGIKPKQDPRTYKSTD